MPSGDSWELVTRFWPNFGKIWAFFAQQGFNVH